MRGASKETPQFSQIEKNGATTFGRITFIITTLSRMVSSAALSEMAISITSLIKEGHCAKSHFAV